MRRTVLALMGALFLIAVACGGGDGETAVVTNKTANNTTLFYCVEYEDEDGTTGKLCKVGLGDFRRKCYDKVEVNDTLLSDCRKHGLTTQ